MTTAPPKPKKAPKAPTAQPRGEKRQHILELLTVEQPRTTDELAYFTGIPLRCISSVLILMERASLVRRVYRGRGQGKVQRVADPGPSSWALRCWSNAHVDLPDTAAQDSASKSNNPAVSG
jgi:hypothetical protein